MDDVTAGLLDTDRADFLYNMPDSITIRRVTLAAAPGQPGRRSGTEAVIGTVPGKVTAAPRAQGGAGGQVQTIADWAIRVPANTNIQTDDRVTAVMGETGEQKDGEVERVDAKTGELARMVYIRRAGR